jgi:SNF2 family DNA or RNA helicase
MLDERNIANPEALQFALEKLLTRTRRVESGLHFAERKYKSIEIEKWKETEEDIYNNLLPLLQGIYRRHLGQAAPLRRPSGWEQSVSQFVLVSITLLREMASHPLAAIKTINNALRPKVVELAGITGDTSDLGKLDDFISKYDPDELSIEEHAKTDKLLSLLNDLTKKKRCQIVYVSYLETKDALMKLISSKFPDLFVLDFHGNLSANQKIQRIEDFWQSDNACLISMDSGGQGLNFQVADTVINYDFPWNPMKLEQRIGRVDRYGQESSVVNVINMMTSGTIEYYVYHTLQEKIEVCRDVLGDFMSPLQVEEIWEKRFSMGIGELILSSRDARDMKRRFETLDKDGLRNYVRKYEKYVMRERRWLGE